MPTKTRSRSRTAARTKTKVILASAAIIAAAAAGAYQVDRATYTKQAVEPAEIVRYAEDASVDYQGFGTVRSAVVEFEASQDIMPQATLLVTFHEGVETQKSSTTVEVDRSLMKNFPVIPSGRAISLVYNGFSAIPAGAQFEIEVANLITSTTRLSDGPLAVAVVQTAPSGDEIADADEEEDGIPDVEDPDEDLDPFTVLAPTGKEILTAGEGYTVQWTPVRGAGRYTVSFADDATRSFDELGQTSQTSLDVVIPDIETDDARINVWAVREDGSEAGEVFSNTFVVAAPAPQDSGRLGGSDDSDDSGRLGGSDDDVVVIRDNGDDEGDDAETVDSGDASPTGSSGRSNRQPHGTDGGSSTASNNATPATPTPSVAGYNNLIKMECPAQSALETNHPCRTVYYHSTLGTRHPFPNEKVFFTWYNGFSNINIISRDAMAEIPLGQNVTYRPGSTMVKFQSVNTVYLVTRGGVLRAVDSETTAEDLYGLNWNRFIHDISDVFLGNYDIGSPVLFADEFNIAGTYGSVSTITDNF